MIVYPIFVCLFQFLPIFLAYLITPIMVHHYRSDQVSQEDWKKLEQAYKDWIDYHNGDISKRHVIKEKWHFNEQVTAPYLLAYYPAEVKIRESQKDDKYFKSGRAEQVFRSITKTNKDEFNQQAGMNAIAFIPAC